MAVYLLYHELESKQENSCIRNLLYFYLKKYEFFMKSENSDYA